MGHANRPRLHNVVSVDTQSRGVCLPAARWIQSNSNTDPLANRYGYADANSHRNCNGNTDIHACAYSKTYSDAEAASYAAAIGMVINDL
jgi:hypothetical protein